MSLFKKNKTLIQSDCLKGFTDHHCHLLYGVDDGMKTSEESLLTLSYMESLGIHELYLTPHIMEDVRNTTDRLQTRFSELATLYKGSIRLHLAAEYMLDALFEERLANDDLLFLTESHLLVETSYINPPLDLENILFQILQKGYIPLFAHPERYCYLEEIKDYERLKAMGVKFQLNIPSVVGFYGKSVAQKASDLLKHGLYNVVGTDTHALSTFQRILNVSCDVKSIQLLNDLLSNNRL